MGKSKIPEAELIRATYTLRKMDLPPEVSMTRRSMLRWFALASGLISEKESRDTILDVLDMLFQFQFAKKKNPTTNDLLDHIKEKNLEISEKLLRYHLKRLTDFGLIERRNLKYAFCSDSKADKNNIRAGYKAVIAEHVTETLSDVEDALGKLAESYSK